MKVEEALKHPNTLRCKEKRKKEYKNKGMEKKEERDTFAFIKFYLSLSRMKLA